MTSTVQPLFRISLSGKVALANRMIDVAEKAAAMASTPAQAAKAERHLQKMRAKRDELVRRRNRLEVGHD